MEKARALAWAMSLCGILLAAAGSTQEPPLPPALPEEPASEAPPGLPSVAEEAEGPTPGAPTIGLEQAVQLALERNFGLLASGDSVASARFRESAARAQFYPRLTPRYLKGEDGSSYVLDAFQRLPWTGGSVSASSGFRTIEADASEPPGRRSNLLVTLTQPLLRGFGPNTTFFELTNSRRTRQAAERGYELQRQRLAVEVISAFYEVVRQRALLGVSGQSLKRLTGLREASEARMKVGLTSKLDVFRAELQASQAEDSLVQSRATLETALERFRALLGLSPSDPVEPAAVALSERSAELEPEPAEVLVRRALQSRLELAEARDQADDARRSFALARRNLLPQLDLNLAYTQSGFGDSFGDALRLGDSRLALSLSTSYPLERSGDRASRAIAEIGLERSRRDLRQRELEVEAEVRQALRSLERIGKSLELQRKSVELAAQQHRLATLRYQRGLASNFDVVDAEGSLVSARSTLVSLLSQHQVARYELLRAVGTLDLARELRP